MLLKLFISFSVMLDNMVYVISLWLPFIVPYISSLYLTCIRWFEFEAKLKLTAKIHYYCSSGEG